MVGCLVGHDCDLVDVVVYEDLNIEQCGPLGGFQVSDVLGRGVRVN